MLDWLSAEGVQSQSAQCVRVARTGIVTQGIMSGTRVASNLGWRVAEALAPGDKILTFDNGMQVVTEVRREVLWMDSTSVPETHWPVHVPVGALSNRVAMTMMPDQGVLVESDVADDALQDPFAVLVARQLVGLRGISRVAPRAQVEVITLVFAEAQVVYAEGGALIHCARQGDLLTDFISDHAGRYPVLSGDLAALVLDEMRTEDELGRQNDNLNPEFGVLT